MSVPDDNDPLPEEFGAAGNGFDDGAREIARLAEENAALKDRALRALAEVENVRKRLERERDEARQYSVAKFARDLLTVADNLTRALAAYAPEKHGPVEGELKGVLDGVAATERELQAVLARNGVKTIEAAGMRFDPNLHQAIAEVPGSGQAPGTVVDVVQPGYVIGERLLRAAMVTVAKGEAVSPGGPGGHIDTKV